MLTANSSSHATALLMGLIVCYNQDKLRCKYVLCIISLIQEAAVYYTLLGL